jgi:Ca2+-binding EF-hand superfamily protein
MKKIKYKPPTRALIEHEFSQFDQTNCGYITINDFYDIMRRIKPNYSKKMVEEMIGNIDADKNKRITLEEFIHLFY